MKQVKFTQGGNEHWIAPSANVVASYIEYAARCGVQITEDQAVAIAAGKAVPEGLKGTLGYRPKEEPAPAAAEPGK